MVTDVDSSGRNKAVRLVEKQLNTISKTLPQGFEIPQVAVVDFTKHGLNPDAIGGYEHKSGVLYFNSKYDTKEKVIKYVNRYEGQFANTTEYAPILHELGHKYYYDSVERLAKSENLSYTKARNKIDRKIYRCIVGENFDYSNLIKTISKYARISYGSGDYTEVIAEAFSAKGMGGFSEKLIRALEE